MNIRDKISTSNLSLWDKCINRLKNEMSSEHFGMWISPLQPVEENKTIIVYAPNGFVKEWVEKNYYNRIIKLIEEVSVDKDLKVILTIGGNNEEIRKEKLRKPKVTSLKGQNKDIELQKKLKETNINPIFTFDSFIEGKSNQIAKAASVQVGNNPGRSYNPLFIYGGVGLGKTHLMHAVGNAILRNKPESNVIYLHSERFVSEMVKALQHNKIDQFKRRYRTVNALLIDDVQFFAGKERTQEEFFHTFNALFESQQQIVLSSDRFPKEVVGLEERLKSRFGWGLTVAIEPPDLETRVAILQSKSIQLGIDISQEVAFFVGKHIRSNIRELEGALRRLVANAQFTGKPITVEFSKEALRDMLAAQEKQITIDNIQKVVSEYYQIRIGELLSRKRTRSIARPRQVAMTLAKELTCNSLPEIGNAFGGRDHTTVLHATKKIKELKLVDVKVDEDYRRLLKILSN